MCTVVISLEPTTVLPLLFLEIRDEVLGRAWARPARHWPQQPGVFGGLDTQAGGTWLAVDPAARRISCVLNGRGKFPPAEGRRSPGELPLTAVAGEAIPSDLSRLSPFHLITADPTNGAQLASWNGREFSEAPLSPGVTVIANTGIDPDHPRVAQLTSLLSKAPRPDPQVSDSPQTAWASWLEVLSAQDVEPDDLHAIIRRRLLEGNILHGSNSVTMIAASRTYIRYDFVTVHNPPLPLTDFTQTLEEHTGHPVAD